MRYKVKVKGEAELLQIEADDVDLNIEECGRDTEEQGDAVRFAVADYNFLTAGRTKDDDQISVARIPYNNVVYIAKV